MAKAIVNKVGDKENVRLEGTIIKFDVSSKKDELEYDALLVQIEETEREILQCDTNIQFHTEKKIALEEKFSELLELKASVPNPLAEEE